PAPAATAPRASGARRADPPAGQLPPAQAGGWSSGAGWWDPLSCLSLCLSLCLCFSSSSSSSCSCLCLCFCLCFSLKPSSCSSPASSGCGGGGGALSAGGFRPIGYTCSSTTSSTKNSVASPAASCPCSVWATPHDSPTTTEASTKVMSL